MDGALPRYPNPYRIDVLWHAQAVCRPWRQLALDPEFWRIIDMRGHSDLFNTIGLEEPTRIAVDCSGTIDLEEPTRIAVDCSGGCVEELYLDNFGSDKLLEYIADRSTRLNCIWCKPNSMDPDDTNEAIEIADSMPQLRELQLVGNQMTNKGLHAILDKCLQLESLDIRVCLSVNLDDDLRSKLAKINDVKLPNDSTAGYEFGVNANMFGKEYLSGDSDPCLTYGDFFDYGTDFSYDDFTVPDHFDGDEDDYPSFVM